jgi:hypothetical protein
MVSHETVGVDLETGFSADFGQALEEILPVNVIEEDVLAAVAAAYD